MIPLLLEPNPPYVCCPSLTRWWNSPFGLPSSRSNGIQGSNLDACQKQQRRIRMLNPLALAHPVSLVECLARRRDSPRESLSQIQML